MADPTFAPAVAAISDVSNTAQPTAGQGLALDANGVVPPTVLAPSPVDLEFLQYNAATGHSQWGTVATVGYGTSLPGSPTDGQEYTLVDSTTSPTYQWRFRYNSGSSNADKWECIGGAPALVEVATAETLPSTGAYVALTTAGPSFTVPRAGVYHVEIGAKFNPGAAAHTGRMSYDIGGTGAVDADSTYEGTGSGDQYGSSVMRVHQKAGLAASTALVSKYKATATSDGFEFRWMRVLPVRVS